MCVSECVCVSVCVSVSVCGWVCECVCVSVCVCVCAQEIYCLEIPSYAMTQCVVQPSEASSA